MKINSRGTYGILALEELVRKVLVTWRKANAAMDEIIDGVTLADVCETAERPHMYYSAGHYM